MCRDIAAGLKRNNLLSRWFVSRLGVTAGDVLLAGVCPQHIYPCHGHRKQRSASCFEGMLGRMR